MCSATRSSVDLAAEGAPRESPAADDDAVALDFPMQRRQALHGAYRRAALGAILAAFALMAPTGLAALPFLIAGLPVVAQALIAIVTLRSMTDAGFALRIEGTRLHIPSPWGWRVLSFDVLDIDTLEVVTRGAVGFVMLGRSGHFAVSFSSSSFVREGDFGRAIARLEWLLSADVVAERPDRSAPWVALATACVLVALHVARLLFPGDPDPGDSLALWGAVHGSLVLEGDVYRLFMAGLLHASTMHLLSNLMLFLFLMMQFEFIFGWKRALTLLCIANVCAATCAAVFSDLLTVGASGAIYGVGGFLCVLAVIRRELVPVRLRGGMPWWCLAGLIVVDTTIGTMVPQISFSMHTGGFLTGAVLAAYWYRADLLAWWQRVGGSLRRAAR